MYFSDRFYLDIKKINIAHRYILDRAHKCSYTKGRGQYGLVYALAGKAQYRFSTGERFWLLPGDLLFLTPNNAYSIATEKEFKHYTVNFEIHTESSSLDTLDCPYYLLQNENVDQIERTFRRLVDVWRKKKPGFEMQAMGSLYELLASFYFALTNGKRPAAYRRMLPAKEYIEENYAENVSLDHLAQLVHMSTTNFRREWKKVYADSPIQYRDSIRLYYAKEYLQSGYYTIAEIAEKCGFEDPSYFTRFYKKQTGITPSEDKKQYFES